MTSSDEPFQQQASECQPVLRAQPFFEAHGMGSVESNPERRRWVSFALPILNGMTEM